MLNFDKVIVTIINNSITIVNDCKGIMFCDNAICTKIIALL